MRKAWPLLVGLVAGGILLICGIAWLLLFGLGMWKGKVPGKTTVEGKAAVAQAPAAPTAGAQVETGKTAVVSATVVEATSAPPSVVAAPQVPEPVVATSAPPATEVVVTPSVTASAGGVTTGVSATLPAATPETVAAETAKPVEVVPVFWPKLIVTGLIGSPRSGKSAAIINKQMVEPGAVIEGVKVQAIDKQGVKLSYQGETRTLSVGGSTE